MANFQVPWDEAGSERQAQAGRGLPGFKAPGSSSPDLPLAEVTAWGPELVKGKRNGKPPNFWERWNFY